MQGSILPDMVQGVQGQMTNLFRKTYVKQENSK